MGLTEAVLRGLLYGLVSPIIFVPGLAIGWLARAWWQVVAGAVLLAVVLFAASQVMIQGRLPEGAQTVWWLAPVGVLPPLAHAAIGHSLRGWLGRNRGSPGAKLGACLISAVIGLAVGAGLGGVGGFFIGDAYVKWAHVSKFEGGAGYMVFFLFVIPGGLICAVAGAILAWRLTARRWAAPKA